MRLIYATDMHGNRPAYEQLFEAATKENVDAIVIGGDVCPNKIVAVFNGGEVLPLEVLRYAHGPDSYRGSIEQWLEFTKGRSNDLVVQDLVNKGMLWKTGLNLSDVIAEEALLERLNVFFGDNLRGVELFTDEDIQLIEERIVPLVMAEENSWSESERRYVITQCERAFRLKAKDFSEVRPSKYFAASFKARLPHMLGKMRDLPVEEREFWLNALSFTSVINSTMMGAIGQRSTAAQLEGRELDFDLIGKLQKEFLSEFLLPLISRWQTKNGYRPVFVLLGNDDVMTVSETLDASPECLSLHGKSYMNIAPGVHIAGCGFVESLPTEIQYVAWERNSEEMVEELTRVKPAEAGETIWVIHHPAMGFLDEVESGVHLGSVAVRNFLSETRPRWALFGHIHEAASVAQSSVKAMDEHTLCVNPGGYHTPYVAAVVIDTDTRFVKRLEK
jgi:Icc-related predicted phosphoesterase